ncbi:MAG TPA: TetR/AcrR family transcriptional regulator [Actinomycetes bacterium]|nr:TetR/AcrR family transcriptional regulator [Actinomycetes bacterium]
MGNREALLAAAKRCLYEKGYARTTARDIAAASGVSLAAIGYHFGSKDALLNEARIQAIGEWNAELTRALAADVGPDATPMERFEAIWTKVIESFETHRPLWAASFELLTEIDQAPEVRKVVAEAQERARLGLASLFHGLDPALDEHTAWVVGSFYLALLPGVMAQWLIDPEHAPSGRDLADALRAILADLSPGGG